VYEEGCEIELLKVIGKALNMSLDMADLGEVLEYLFAQDGKEVEILKGQPFVYVGWYAAVFPLVDFSYEYTRSYLSVRIVWYTPCAVKYRRWSRFFNIFSVDMWICFALSLVLAVITVSCISNYTHKSHLHESKSYSNIFSVTANIIAVLLSVSVNTQPRCAPLRLFFFCWVCYSVAISTVFQAYLTTFLIEPGYEEPIKNIDQMLKSEIKYGFDANYTVLFTNTADPVESAIRKDPVPCPEVECFKWAALHHNISTMLNDLVVGTQCAKGYWTDENNKPLLCELEDGVVRTVHFTILVRKRSPFFELIDDIIGRLVEGGIFMRIMKRGFEKEKIESKFNSFTFDNTYYDINIRHLQTAFYLLMLGYVLAFACFLMEIMWHCCRSKVCEPTGTFPYHVQT
jgi:hypothetical protein